MNPFKRNAGQFVPISAMVMFAMVIFMIAVVNIYRVSRAKLLVQNIADAAALNLASQQAQAYNIVSDRNEWLNHMTAGIDSPTDEKGSIYQNCKPFYTAQMQKVVPPIYCVENNSQKTEGDTGGYVFHARGDAANGAIAYALLIHTVNVAQALFAQAYNSFIGVAGGTSSQNSAGSFRDLLRQDIKELSDGSVYLYAWNYGQDPSAAQIAQSASQHAGDATAYLEPNMAPLQFKVDHDIQVSYDTKDNEHNPTTLGKLLYEKVGYPPGHGISPYGPLYGQPFEEVGIMKPDPQMQKITVNKAGGGSGSHTGVGVYVSKTVNLGPILGSKLVMAKSKAYIVKDSGNEYKASYWVKLGN